MIRSEHLANAEANDRFLVVDQIAFYIAVAHRARLLNGNNLLTDRYPRLKKQFEDCLEQDSSPLDSHQALLMLAMSDLRDREDNLGYIVDAILRDNC